MGPLKRARLDSLTKNVSHETHAHLAASFLPCILYEEELLVPIKLDITYGGCRFQDSFCWKLYGSSITPITFAAQTCSDLCLDQSFQQRIALQLSEQLHAYRQLIVSLHAFASTHKLDSPQWQEKLKQQLLALDICIRCNTLEYSEILYWDPMNAEISPEAFARTTCADQGLPSTMEPVIAYKIRDAIFREVVRWVEKDFFLVAAASTATARKAKTMTSPGKSKSSEGRRPCVSKIKIELVPSAKMEEKAIAVLSKEKPYDTETQTILPNSAYLPANKESNSVLFL